STVTRSENEAQSLRALLSAIRWAMRSSHSKRRLVSKWVHWRQARMAAWQLGHCSSVEFAIGSTAPQAAHRDTVCCASIPPLRGASLGGVDYIRWPWEPGRSLTRTDLGVEFATIECSLGEDLRGCPYGVDASAAFMPAGTKMYAVRGYATEFRLAAVWKDHVFLYQVWRNPRAKVGGDLYDLRDRVRAIDVRRGEPTSTSTARPVEITAPGEVAALVAMVARGAMRR